VRKLGDLVFLVAAVGVAVWAYFKFKAVQDTGQSLTSAITGAINSATSAVNSAFGPDGVATAVSKNFKDAPDYIFGSQEDQAMNADAGPWKVWLAPEVDDGETGPDGNPKSWADYFATPQQVLDSQAREKSGADNMSGNAILDYAWTKIFGSGTSQNSTPAVPAGFPDYPVNPEAW
jgi:hypothetical protein